MEDMPKHLEREISRLTGAKSQVTSKRWHLMFVSDSGRIVSFRGFRTLAVLLVVLIAAGFGTAAVLYLFYERATLENDNLKSTVSLLNRQMEKISDGKAKLAARFIAVKSRLDAVNAQRDETAADQTPPPGDDATEDSAAQLPADTADTDTLTDAAAFTAADGQGAPEPMAGQTVGVAIEAFQVIRKPGQDRLQLQFKIVNTGSGAHPVSGYIFVKLIGSSGPPDSWPVFPEVTVDSGEPARVNKGRYFSIQRFKTVRIAAGGDALPQSIQSAVVKVYDDGGSLILEKSFPIDES